MQKKRKKKIYRKFFNLILIFAEYELSVEIIIRYIVLNLEKYLFKFFLYINEIFFIYIRLFNKQIKLNSECFWTQLNHEFKYNY